VSSAFFAFYPCWPVFDLGFSGNLKIAILRQAYYSFSYKFPQQSTSDQEQESNCESYLLELVNGTNSL
jgi:hypothetical protein